MKRGDLFIYAAVGGVIGYVLLRKPVARATWSLFAGPKFYANLNETISRGDPVEIRRMKMKYENWSPMIQEQFDETLKSMRLKRPW